MTRKEMLKYVVLLHVTMIMANILLITLQPLPRGIVGILLMAATCMMMYNEGAGFGERACSMSKSIAKSERPLEKSVLAEGYSPRRTLKSVVICGIIPFALSVVYICTYYVTLNVQGTIYGQDTLEIQEEAQQSGYEIGDITYEDLENYAEQNIEAEEEAAEETDEDDVFGNATVSLDEDGNVVLDPGQEIEPLSGWDRAVFALRVVTCILGLPYWSAVAMLQSQYVILTPLSIILLLVYPFVWPMMMYFGYLRGPKLWAATEDAMAKGKRRAKARSRIFRKKQSDHEQKPMI